MWYRQEGGEREMKTCKTCYFWTRRGASPLETIMRFFGDCDHKQKLVSLRSGEGIYASQRDALLADSLTPAFIITGEDFGCVHWMEKEEEDGQKLRCSNELYRCARVGSQTRSASRSSWTSVSTPEILSRPRPAPPSQPSLQSRGKS